MSRAFARVVILLTLAVSGIAPARAESPEEAFLRGGREYDAGRYDEAAKVYEELLARGIADPRVEFNLGNVEFRRGRLGSAILHFERARRLDPADPEIRANLEFARASAGGSPEAADPEPTAVTLVRHAFEQVGPGRLAWWALGLFWVVAGVLTWALAEPGRFRAGHGWILAALLATLACVTTAGYVMHRRLVGHQVAVVLSTQAPVLAGPGGNNAQLATVPEGLALEVWGERAEWVNVRLPNNVSGWIERDAVGLVP
jgi:tetratricopeptide repeat protein